MQETKIKRLTVRSIIALDPEVGRILDGVRRTEDDRAWHREYARIKRLLTGHVGWLARDGAPRELVTQEAYDVVHAEMVRRLGGTVGA